MSDDTLPNSPPPIGSEPDRLHLQDPSTPLDAETALIADLNRLLREGLATVEWSADAPPRFQVTPAGQAYLDATAPAVRVHVRITGIDDARAPS